MADLVEVLIEDARWNETGLGRLAQKSCVAAISYFGLDPEQHEISVLGCDDARISQLNSEFRDNSQPTNVLSWPVLELVRPEAGQPPYLPPAGSLEMPNELGDIAISFETCAREAAAGGLNFEEHVAHLLVHATLHLLGYDHIVKEDAELMEDFERQVLAIMGYPDPYGDN